MRRRARRRAGGHAVRRGLGGAFAAVVIGATSLAVADGSAAFAASCEAIDPFDGTWSADYVAATGDAHVSVSVEDVSTGCRFHLGATDQFPPASVAKAQILAVALLQQQDGGATSVPAWLDALARPMIVESDNDAASALTDAVGGGSALAAYGRRIGMTATDNTQYSWGGSPTTTDDQLALLHALLVGDGPLGAPFVAYARSLLSSVDPDQAWGVSAGVPAGAQTYLKNGWLLNDGTMWGAAGAWRVGSVGMVQLGNGRRYLFAELGDQWPSMVAGIDAIESAARRVAAVLARPRGIPLPGGPAASAATAAELATDGDAGATATDQAGTVGADVSSPSVFTAVTPVRLADTRATAGRLAAGGELTIDVAAAAGAGATRLTAAAVNVTAVDTAGAGYLSVYPGGAARPLASNLNPAAGRATANVAVVPVGADGTVRVYASTSTDVVVDLLGVWREAGAAGAGVAGAAPAVRAGRIVTVEPTRLADTRAGGSAVAAGGSVRVPVAGFAGVPTSGVAAALVTVTATETPGAGYWTVWPSGQPRPNASNLNTGAHDTAANTTLVPLGADGSISVFSQSGGQVIVDVVGWVTDATAPAGTAGELVSLPRPTRAVDSRFGDGGVDRLGPWAPALVSLGPVGVPASASAVLANLTFAAPTADGFITAYPSDGERPATSTANPSAVRGVGANAMVTSVSGGSFRLYASASTEVLVDVWGWLTS